MSIIRPFSGVLSGVRAPGRNQFFISTIISLDYISVLNNFPIYAQGYYF